MLLENEVYQRIIENEEKMSKSQKKIANYLINNPERAPFLTASRLAKIIGVGDATIVRFAYFLDYKDYPDLQRNLQQAMQRKLTFSEVFTQTTAGSEDDASNVLQEILSDDIQNLKTTLNLVDPLVFKEAVEEIIKAKRIYIIAFRSVVSLGSFLQIYLDLVFQNTELIRQGDGVSEHLLDLTEDDLVIAIGFARYTKRTINILKYVKQRGIKTVVITDHYLSPLAQYGDKTLHAATKINSFIDSFAAPLSIINSLITAVTRSEHKKVEKRLMDLEELWDTFQIFHE